MSHPLDQVRAAIRTRHYSIRTEEAYIRWIREYIFFFDKRHPDGLGAKDVSVFISHLAVNRDVAASTQNQALSALLFLYREVLDQPVEWVEDVVRAKRPKKLPVVFTREEVKAVLGHLRGEAWLMASLLYGSGLRLMECVRLRVKDVDFARLQITVREGKGDKDRVTMLPPSLSSGRCTGNWRGSKRCTRWTCARASGGSICLTHWRASTPTLTGSGAGSMSSRPPGDP
jgi:integrase